jgi:hypothetical protein
LYNNIAVSHFFHLIQSQIDSERMIFYHMFNM